MRIVVCRILSIFLLFSFNFSLAKMLNIEINEGSENKLPILLMPFSNANSSNLVDSNIFHDVVKKDLYYSGRFDVGNVPAKRNAKEHIISMLQTGKDSKKYAAYDHVLIGDIKNTEEGLYSVKVSLIDLYKSENLARKIQSESVVNFSDNVDSNLITVFSKTFENIRIEQFRTLAHHISDLVYEGVVGKKGVFSNKIAYIRHFDVRKKSWWSETVTPQHSLVVADYDGENAEELIVSDKPLMSPSWSYDGKKIAYTSYENDRSQVFVIDLATSERTMLSSFKGVNGAPAFSPNSDALALVLSKDGSPNLYLYDLNSKSYKKLTSGYAIDTEPSWSSDGSKIIFTSNRGGGPQVYSYNLSSGKVERLSFTGKYNASASYTPDGKNIIMMHRRERGYNFQLGMQNLNSGEFTSLTKNNYDASPSVSPNGDLVVYSRKVGNHFELNMVSVSGANNHKLKTASGSIEFPRWSPYLG